MKNQCDGCRAGIPVVNGTHRMGREGGYPDLMGCTAKQYAEVVDATAAPEQTYGYTAVDVATAAADGFRDGKANVVVDLSKHHGGQHLPGSERMFLSDVIAAIEAAGGSVKK